MLPAALFAVVADSLHGAAFHGFHTDFYLSVCLGLLANIGNTLIIVAGEEVGSGITAKVTVDAVAIYIELAGNILFSFFVDIGHIVYGVLIAHPYFLLIFARMQSFFVATRHFSGQNRVMQAPEEQEKPTKTPQRKIYNLIWGSLFGLALLGFAGFGVYVYKDVPTSDGRFISAVTPWTGAGVVVENAEAAWQSSAGNARMELRAAYYPVLHLQLGKGDGSGHILVHFADAGGVQKGDTVALAYEKGQFLPSRDINVQTKGNTAVAHVELGFATKDEYLVHKFTESSPLWRVVVTNRPAGSYDEQYIGYTCVRPDAQ